MDLLLCGLVSLAVGILAGGFLGYRYGRSVQATAQAIEGAVQGKPVP